MIREREREEGIEDFSTELTEKDDNVSVELFKSTTEKVIVF